MIPFEFEVSPEVCKVVRSILARVADKWSMTTIVALRAGPRRFNELRRSTGATQKMLTRTLRDLEREGYVIRTVKIGPVLNVSYGLTEDGRDLLPQIHNLFHWALANIGRVERSRADFDASVKDSIG